MGQPKTGTSILQNALILLSRDNAAFTYPDAFRKPGVGHHSLANTLKSETDFEAALSRLNACLEELRGRDVVFSSEQFSNTIGPRHRNLFARLVTACGAFDEVTALIYMRRYDEFINSMLLQSVRYGGYRDTPEAYARQRYKGIDTWFSAIAYQRVQSGMTFRPFAYVPKFDVLEHFQQVCPSTSGLSDVGPLPQTEKFSWKLQVFIAAATKILGAPLEAEAMGRMVVHIRKENIKLEGDFMKYCILPPAVDQELRDLALQGAQTHKVTEYTEAFESVGKEDKNYVPFDASVLSKKDIAQLRACMV
jgi:hypothetical protein